MSAHMFQQVFSLVEGFLPDSWSELVFYAEYDQASFSVEFYVQLPGGPFVSCYELEEVERKQLIDLFVDIDKVIAGERAKLSPKELWTTMTMVVSNKGNVKVDYEYDDLTETSYEHKKAWEKAYLHAGDDALRRNEPDCI